MGTLRTNIGRRLEILSAALAHEAATGEGLGVVGVSDAVGREKSQVSRALRVLADAGLVERDPDSLEFVIGGRLLDMAGRAGDPDLLDAARPIVHRLAAELDERVGLVVRDGHQALVVDTITAPGPLQAVAPIGSVWPLHSTAAGRALLFDDAPEQLEQLLGDEVPRADGAPTTLADLAAKVAEEHERGVAFADGDSHGDVASAAAPVRDASATICAALAVSGPRFRLTERIALVTDAVRRGADDVTRALAARAKVD